MDMSFGEINGLGLTIYSGILFDFFKRLFWLYHTQFQTTLNLLSEYFVQYGSNSEAVRNKQFIFSQDPSLACDWVH